MRKLIFGINITLDGCCDHTKGIGDDEVHDYFAQLLHNADVLVYGRKTYQLMVPFWPDIANDLSAPTKAINDFAVAFNSVPKIVVFSRTLAHPTDKKTIVFKGNLKDEILRLKNEEGKDIMVGGVDLPAQLLQLDLIDEFHFVVQPIIVGEGRRLFDQIDIKKLELRKIEVKEFKSGCVAVRYERY
jgi:dihydrofolate reductase